MEVQLEKDSADGATAPHFAFLLCTGKIVFINLENKEKN